MTTSAGTQPRSRSARPPGTEAPTRRAALLSRMGWYALVIGLVLAILSDRFTEQGVGVLAMALMLLLMFLKVPIWSALASTGMLGIYQVVGTRAVETVLLEGVYDGVASWELSVIPMFVLMGLFLWQSGLTSQMYRAGRLWLHWLPGGLGIGTTLTGAGLSAVSGTGLGTMYALGRIGIPEMLAVGYSRRLAVGSVLMSSMAGVLIPPSIMAIIYAGIAEVPIGPMLMACIIPGALITALICVQMWIMGVARPELVRGTEASPTAAPSWRERFAVLASLWEFPVLVVVVLGGMFAGLLTATEAGAAGAFGSLVTLLVAKRRGERFPAVAEACRGTVRTCGAIFGLVIGALIFSRMVSVTGIGQSFTQWVVDLELGRVEFLVLMFFAYVVLGMFLDPLSMMLLTVPFLIPTLANLEISLFWYGVFTMFMGEVAVLSPPIGILIFIVFKLVQDPEVNVGQSFTMRDVWMSAVWFLPVVAVFIATLIAFPGLVTWLPDRME